MPRRRASRSSGASSATTPTSRSSSASCAGEPRAARAATPTRRRRRPRRRRARRATKGAKAQARLGVREGRRQGRRVEVGWRVEGAPRRIRSHRTRGAQARGTRAMKPFLFLSARPEVEAVGPEYESVRRAMGLDAGRLEHIRLDVDPLAHDFRIERVRGRRGRRQPLQRDDARGRRSTACSGASRPTSPGSPRPRSTATIRCSSPATASACSRACSAARSAPSTARRRPPSRSC